MSDEQVIRHRTRRVSVGAVTIGDGSPVVVQSMTNTDTADMQATVQQVAALAQAGSEMVRITVNSPEAAAQVALAYRRQLALYRALLAEIYPGRTVRAFLLWTAVPMLMEIDAKTLDESMPYAAAS